MSGTKWCLASLVAAVVGLGTARGQGTMYGPSSGSDVLPARAPAVAPAVVPPGPSRWILYDGSPGCCGPTGGNGSIGYEAYVRNGIAFPISGGLGAALDNGWTIEGGARTLFFNPQEDEAWTVDLGLGNTYNRVGNRSKTFVNGNTLTTNEVFTFTPAGAVTPTTIDGPPIVTGADLNRTYAFISGGREWYLWGSAEHDCAGRSWRAGMDLGGRYGTEKLDVNETRHMTGTNESLFINVHSDLEIPWGQVLFQAGIRLEYSYTWSDVFHSPSNADVADISLLFNLGMRF